MVFSILLVPVYGVRAGEEDSWRVRMPVVQPVENIVRNSVLTNNIYLHDLKRPVNDIVISAEPLPMVAAVTADVPKKISPNGASTSGSVGSLGEDNDGIVASEKVASPDNKSGKVYASASSTNLKKIPKESDISSALDSDDVRKEFSSVSLVPSDNDEMRRWKSSEDGSFFSTPKRFFGLDKKFIRAIPAISLREMYDSNVDYTDVDDFVTEITPSLKMDIIGEDVNIKFNGDFIYRDYLNNSKFDRYDYNVNLAGKYKFSPTLDAGISLAHKRYHNLDQNTYEAGGVEIDPTIVLKTTATPEVNWQITERDTLRISNYVDKTDYERKADSDYVTNVLSVVWGHVLPNEVTSFFAGQMSTFTHYSREIDGLNSDQVSFQGVVGIDHQFSPGWKISVKGGPGTTFSNYSNDQITGESQDFLYQFRAEVGYRQLKFSVVPAIERSVRPGRYGENEIMDQAEIYFRYDLDEFLKYDTINTYWMNESEGTNGGQKHKATGLFTQHIMSWEFDEDWKTFAGVSYNWGRNELSGATNERIKTWVGISFAFPTEIK